MRSTTSWGVRMGNPETVAMNVLLLPDWVESFRETAPDLTLFSLDLSLPIARLEVSRPIHAT